MGKFSQYETAVRQKERPWRVHPIWRGIGCLLFLLVPVMSYAGAKLLFAANYRNGWLPTPGELLVSPLGLPINYMELILLILLIFIGFGILITIYSAVYRFIGPPKYGPTDAEPIRSRKGVRRSKAR